MQSVCEVQAVLLVGDHARLLQYAGHCNRTPQANWETHKLARSECYTPYMSKGNTSFWLTSFIFVREEETFKAGNVCINSLSLLKSCQGNGRQGHECTYSIWTLCIQACLYSRSVDWKAKIQSNIDDLGKIGWYTGNCCGEELENEEQLSR